MSLSTSSGWIEWNNISPGRHPHVRFKELVQLARAPNRITAYEPVPFTPPIPWQAVSPHLNIAGLLWRWL